MGGGGVCGTTSLIFDTSLGGVGATFTRSTMPPMRTAPNESCARRAKLTPPKRREPDSNDKDATLCEGRSIKILRCKPACAGGRILRPCEAVVYRYYKKSHMRYAGAKNARSAYAAASMRSTSATISRRWNGLDSTLACLGAPEDGCRATAAKPEMNKNLR